MIRTDMGSFKKESNDTFFKLAWKDLLPEKFGKNITTDQKCKFGQIVSRPLQNIILKQWQEMKDSEMGTKILMSSTTTTLIITFKNFVATFLILSANVSDVVRVR
ncbi:unnamed protein product [Allacma fusca]|uniref:Uncharacterized protein n=1 Tax=Allacma fusca TaxID=39272 RepID=A0A8J2NQV1_9HEXA|nr:unnamed protein product [Allacma fusca]